MKDKPPIVNRLRAAKAYADFTGRVPDKSYTVQLDDYPTAGYALGQAVGVAYEATRDGVTEQYFHKFKRAARPDLVARDDGSQLYFTRGRYKVGERGIEDMPPLMVINPAARPSKRGNIGRNAKGRFMRLSARPSRRRRRSRSPRVIVMRTNPLGIRRRRRPAATSHRRRRSAMPALYRANPAPRRRRRGYRRNPTGTAGNLRIWTLILPAASIGAGAIGSELVMGYLPIPANFKTGTLRHVTKGVISLIGGAAIAKFANRKIGEDFALGGMTIAFHDAFKDLILNFMPSAQFGGLGYYSPASQVPLGNMNMGAYLPRRAGSPGGPSSFGVYMRPGMAGHASDGGPQGPAFGL